MSNLGGILQKNPDLNLIIGGDFNCPITSADKAGGSSVLKKKKVIDEVNSLCQGFQLQDIWRSQHPNQTQYTWRNKSFKIQCRLDYWLVSRDLSSLVIKSDIIHATISDHSAITVNLQSKEYAKRGPGFWKFNNSLLKDDTFVKNLAEKIPEFKDKHAYLTEKGLYWDMLKMEIRGFCVQYSKRKNRDKRNEERDLQKQIDTLMIALQTNRTKDNITRLHTLRARLNQIAEYRTRGAMVRSRVRWHEEGERNTKYFLNLEKRNFSSTHISRLKTREGNETTNAEEILSMQKRFYEQLYAQVPCTNEDGDCDDTFLPGLTGKRTELNFLANGSKRQSGELTLSTNSATGGQKSVTNFWIPGICGNWTSDKPRETSQDLLSLVFNVSTM